MAGPMQHRRVVDVVRAKALGSTCHQFLVRLLQGQDVGGAQPRLALEQGQDGTRPLDQLDVVGRDAEPACGRVPVALERRDFPRETRAPRFPVVVGLSPAQWQRPARDTPLPAT
jgi:hypothetical protein